MIKMIDNRNSGRFQGKYRIKSARLQTWDYSNNGAYFVTICTRNREHSFGEIVNAQLQDTEAKRICNECWYDLPSHYRNCILDEFVIMPNHIHGIIFIENHSAAKTDFVETGLKPVSTLHGKRYSLSEIIRGFKTFTAQKINKRQRTEGIPFWQPRFYDRIVRDEDELNRIRMYIIQNPSNWDQNKDITGNLFM